MDTYASLIIAEHQLALGLVLNTRKMSVAITEEYLAETLHILKTTWRKRIPTRLGRQRFTAIETSRIVGKLTQLTERAPWARYLVSQLYTSIVFALA